MRNDYVPQALTFTKWIKRPGVGDLSSYQRLSNHTHIHIHTQERTRKCAWAVGLRIHKPMLVLVRGIENTRHIRTRQFFRDRLIRIYSNFMAENLINRHVGSRPIGRHISVLNENSSCLLLISWHFIWTLWRGTVPLRRDIQQRQ